MSYHNPVLLNESIDGLNIQPNGIYVDVTFGGGGHSKEILKKLTTGHLYAFDQDEDAWINSENIKKDGFTLIKTNFKFLKKFLKLHKVEKVNGILADLGVSSYQFDIDERGFSIRFDGPLDMRMDKKAILTAEEVINNYPVEQLAQLFRMYGEIKNYMHLARVIETARKLKQISSTNEFIHVIKPCTPKLKENKYLAQVFQAIRIEVNNELDALKQLLEQSSSLLVKGGRLVVISYHSLEDRLVKNFIREGKCVGIAEKDIYGHSNLSFKAINKKPIIPDSTEIDSNSRARSAKLRIAEKI